MMRVLSVAEINVRAVYRFRGVSPPPQRDPMVPQYLEDEALDEEVAAIMACNPINVAPLLEFVGYNSPDPLYPEIREIEEHLREPDQEVEEAVVAVSPAENNEDEEIAELWEAREAEEAAARLMARQAEARAEEEEEEENNARMRLLRDAEEEEEEAGDEVIDSGVDSDGDDNMMSESSASSSSSSSSSSSDEEDAPYNPVRDPEREARLHRLLGLRKRLWTVRQKLIRLERKQDLLRIQNKLNRVRRRRTQFMRNLTREQRRRLPGPQVERPRRNRDFCYGCGRFYLVQRVRWWWRCDTCGFWLCPDCSNDALHCQRNLLI